jgi:hypothetical protein
MPVIFIPNVILLVLLYGWFFLRRLRTPDGSSIAGERQRRW